MRICTNHLFNMTRSRHFVSEDDSDILSRETLFGKHRNQERVKEFEEKLAKFIGVKYAKAVNSGTNALHLALLSLGIRDNDEVILPSYICASVLSAVKYTRAKPVFVDIDPEFRKKGYNISGRTIKDFINNETKAIIVPHMFGFPCEIDDIISLGVPVIEDCAHSLGAEYKSRKVGSIGDVSIFSFYSTKIISTEQGGMVLTSQEKIKDRLEDLTQYDKRDKYRLSFNYSFTDIQAALGISQLEELNYFLQRRKEIGKIYDKAFSKTRLHLPPKVSGSIQYRYIIKTGNSKEKNFLKEELKKRGIEAASPIFKPLHRYLGLEKNNFRNTEIVQETALTLPSYPALRDEEIEYIKSTLLKILDE